jgi:hypothetical protein
MADERAVVLSDELWRRAFGNRASLGDATIEIRGQLYAVVGVMPPHTALSQWRAEIWLPMNSSSLTQPQDQHILSVSASIVSSDPFTSPNAMTDVQLLVDGVSVADQQYPSGADEAVFTFVKAYTSGGTHQVSIGVLQQRYSTTVYNVLGAASGVFGSTSVNVDFPATNQTLSAGGQVALSVTVP